VSFWTEFFSELKEAYTMGELKEMFCSDEKSLERYFLVG